jgi:hypothetical protein
LVALGVGLVALFAGTALLLACLLLPVPPSQAITVPGTAANRAATMRLDGGQDAPKIAKNLSLRFTAKTQPDINDYFRLTTVSGRNRVAQSGSGIVRSDLKQKAGRPRNCAGTNTDSAHLATLPVCGDPRGALAVIAAHYRGAWTRWDGTGAAAAQAARAVLAPEAAQAAAETVLMVEPIGSLPEGRSRVYSRIAMRPHARWEADLDAGPLTLFVQHGRVGLVLDDGSAHVEVDDLLFGKRSDPVPSGHRVVLWPGDRLVVSRGRHLRVDNDDATLAIISVARLQQSPPSVTIKSE